MPKFTMDNFPEPKIFKMENLNEESTALLEEMLGVSKDHFSYIFGCIEYELEKSDSANYNSGHAAKDVSVVAENMLKYIPMSMNYERVILEKIVNG